MLLTFVDHPLLLTITLFTTSAYFLGPDVCVHNDTNLHSVATYALTDEYQQCTTTKGVTPAAILNTQESHMRAPDPGYIRMATSALAIATTNSTNNMDSTQSNCCNFYHSSEYRQEPLPYAPGMVTPTPARICCIF
ncbi:hypothetical protein Tco_0043986 [Tanacetum coccineum]